MHNHLTRTIVQMDLQIYKHSLYREPIGNRSDKKKTSSVEIFENYLSDEKNFQKRVSAAVNESKCTNDESLYLISDIVLIKSYYENIIVKSRKEDFRL